MIFFLWFHLVLYINYVLFISEVIFHLKKKNIYHKSTKYMQIIILRKAWKLGWVTLTQQILTIQE